MEDSPRKQGTYGRRLDDEDSRAICSGTLDNASQRQGLQQTEGRRGGRRTVEEDGEEGRKGEEPGESRRRRETAVAAAVNTSDN